MREPFLLFLIIVINFGLLLFASSTLSISYYEADAFFNGSDTVHYLIKLSCELFGQNDYALRVPFIIIHTLSTILLYLVSRPILKREIDRLSTVLIFIALPGSIVVSLAANGTALLILGTLMFLYLRQLDKRIAMYAMLVLSLFLSKGFIILYFLLFFYAVNKRDIVIMALSLALFAAGMYMYGFDIGGRPRGYFLDTFSIYGAIFSPLLFLYFIYSLYRILVKGGKTLLWWLSFGAFIASVLLSFRQRIAIEEFASYMIIATPLIVSTFMNSFRVRLPKHRKLHKFFATLVMALLVFNSAVIFANQYLYTFYKNSTKHFAYKYHIAKELSVELKKRGISEVKVEDKKMALRLKFYGIEDSETIELEKTLTGEIEIAYGGIIVERYALINQPI
ncbi:MAG: glycosyltransferase family 39 protein [Campylobacteraceae bacterium]|jgi:4-amino-4-deoxy-L-arabinose transferase-like glycosyltransferase|nr:glycosyltransferase family 39 protein [Campylobacteraceae bacterium]